jgi:hypothetical protein
LHARTSIVIAVVRTRDGNVRIEVACGRWGVAARSDGKAGKTVWFEPAASMSPMAFPVGEPSGGE